MTIQSFANGESLASVRSKINANFSELDARPTGAVESVNSQTGAVVLDASDIAETPDRNYATDAEKATLANTSGTNTGDQDLYFLHSTIYDNTVTEISYNRMVQVIGFSDELGIPANRRLDCTWTGNWEVIAVNSSVVPVYVYDNFGSLQHVVQPGVVSFINISGTSINPIFFRSLTSDEVSKLANTSWTNTGDQDLSGLATLSGATFTGDVVVPDEAYSATTWNGNNEVPTKNAIRDKIESMSVGGGSSLWTAVTGTRTGNTTFTVTGDVTSTFSRGLVIKWTESSSQKCGYVVSSSYSAPDTTVTIIGDIMSSIDASSLKWTAIPAQSMRFAVAGSIGATWTNVANTQRATEPLRVLGANLWVWSAGTTNSTTIDLNKAGTTMFTTKPSLASTVAYSSTPFTADSGTSLAVGDAVTEDVDGVQTTRAVDLYSELIVFPSRILNLS